jgi:hypothetical protein
MQKKRMSYFMEGWGKLEKTCEGRLAFRSGKEYDLNVDNP